MFCVLSKAIKLINTLGDLPGPYVTKTSSPFFISFVAEQKSFNNKVLFNLGVLESRVHLVGMHDAVLESESEVEKEKFQKEIPYVARMMIERWRKSLYAPKGAWALDHISR